MALEKLFTVKEVAVALQVHPLTVRRYIKHGKLNSVRVAGNVRVAQSDFDLFTNRSVIKIEKPKRGLLGRFLKNNK